MALRARLSVAVRALAVVAALGFFVGSTWPTLAPVVSRSPAAAVDYLPLWLHGRSLRGIDIATDAPALSRLFKQPIALGDEVRTGVYYYPPTAAILLLPLTFLPFDRAVDLFRALTIGALCAAAALCVTARGTRGVAATVVAWLLLTTLFLHLRVARTGILEGQVGPTVMALTCACLWALGRCRDRWGALACTLGIGLKLFPLVVLPATLRRRAWWAVPIVVTAGAGVAVATGTLDLAAWLPQVAGFIHPVPAPAWERNEPAFVMILWRLRLVGLGVPTLLLAAWAAFRRAGPGLAAATAALLVAWAGTVMAGNRQPHEALLVVPALGWILAWPLHAGRRLLPWLVAAGTALLLLRFDVTSKFAAPNSLNWIPVGYATWVGCLVRWGWEAVEEEEATRTRDDTPVHPAVDTLPAPGPVH